MLCDWLKNNRRVSHEYTSSLNSSTAQTVESNLVCGQTLSLSIDFCCFFSKTQVDHNNKTQNYNFIKMVCNNFDQVFLKCSI